jgi:hypothetical protein
VDVLVVELCKFSLEVIDRVFAKCVVLLALYDLIVLVGGDQDNPLKVMRNSSPDALEIWYILFVANRPLKSCLFRKNCRLVLIHAEELYSLLAFLLCYDHAIVIWTNGPLFFI